MLVIKAEILNVRMDNLIFFANKMQKDEENDYV